MYEGEDIGHGTFAVMISVIDDSTEAMRLPHVKPTYCWWYHQSKGREQIARIQVLAATHRICGTALQAPESER